MRLGGKSPFFLVAHIDCIFSKNSLADATGKGFIMEMVLFGLIDAWCIPMLIIAFTVFFFPIVCLYLFVGWLSLKLIWKIRDDRYGGRFGIIMGCVQVHLFSVLGVSFVHLCVMCGMAFSNGQNWNNVSGHGLVGNYCKQGPNRDLNWREWIVILSWLF